MLMLYLVISSLLKLGSLNDLILTENFVHYLGRLVDKGLGECSRDRLLGAVRDAGDDGEFSVSFGDRDRAFDCRQWNFLKWCITLRRRKARPTPFSCDTKDAASALSLVPLHP